MLKPMSRSILAAFLVSLALLATSSAYGETFFFSYRFEGNFIPENESWGTGAVLVGEIEGTIGLPVSHQIPRSRGVTVSTDEGIPILEDGGRDPAAKALRELVSGFTPATTGVRAGRFGRKRER